MKNIKHTGIIEQVDGMRLKVRIRQTSACAACEARAHCNASETKERLIDVRNERGIPCREGQQAVICGAASMGLKAVGWAFGLPFAMVVGALFAAMKLTGGNEPLSAVAALAMLIPYYAALRLCRRKLGRSFVFTLESVV